ncbi:aromatic ring-hydroxylating dioxygenase subunit alpha [Komagataeibacter intermedius]|uniref:Vanillate O-demethylase oxygenase subunit n=2 Tax=Komagataeibacter intermedius TaxID=66229 RepID=A0A0N1FRW7_9PROT|nr:aromatic ring-hydroxylating dioxygenase subunit alpha [Komagataeibacter intermedius]KPH88835.1 vanillate O-demethylase oxygenase subunit [Komagataeibacter intermedius AF2]MCF3635314.1 aromatic ring-hydroxylating dioxygenase subunit alpha [Komagataeibacter intermedius]GAN87495.1 vanillate O-demethylase oxygenase subunit [Komagataeibacter intermedius TF2]GBQ67660.1 vanillate O-demethylase oxygenase [Komagataeibacter intermedius NRIC 0521]
MTQITAVDETILSDWYVISPLSQLRTTPTDTMLLDRHITFGQDAQGNPFACDVADRRTLPVRARHGCLWTCPGTPAGDIPAIDEALEPDRRLVDCGVFTVRTSAPRIVENFLDMAHFPFVHTNILGAEPHTEVARYAIELREGGNEVWATDCHFFQPQAALSATDGIDTEYLYRVAGPFVTLLYKTCPAQPERFDVIALFVQPMTQECSRAHPVMFLLDDDAPQADLVEFQQTIFLQDRIILENQRPRRLPLSAGAEIPTMADRMSVAYRRWLRDRGMTYGTTA